MRLAALVLTLVAPQLWAAVPQPAFYLPLDGSTRAAVAAGSPSAAFTTEPDVLFTLINMERKPFVPGRVGTAYEVGNSPLVYRCAGNFRPDEGSCSFWVGPQFRGDDPALYCTFWGAADWGMVYKYENQSSLTFATAKPDRDLYYDCGARDISSWAPGQWHHVALTWSRKANERRIFLDGRLEGQGPFPFAKDIKDGPMFVGAGCTLYPKPVAHAIMDEVALWDQPLTEAQVAEVYALGQAGTALVNVGAEAARQPGQLNVVTPQTPPMPPQAPPAWRKTPTREDLSLDGLWAVLPATEPLDQLPAAGWGFTAIPGYWTDRGKTTGPDGRPVAGFWAGKALDELPVAYLQTTFPAAPNWRGRPVFLNLDGVDGLAEVYLNGTRLGWVDAWEDEAFALGDRVQWEGPNTVTVVLYRRQGSARAGLYGSVSVQVRNGSFVRDTAIRPSVATGTLELDCAVWSAEQRTVTLEADAAPVLGAEPTQRLRQTVTLPAADLAPPDQYSQCRHLTVRLPWPDAHPWCIEDPFRYLLTVRLVDGGQTVDEMPAQEFGFREVTQRGGDVLLNGKPLHLRGHQIDFGWGDQMPRVLELREAGMNSMELSGPIRSDWYAGTPYQQQAFEETLRYADGRGLIAVPVLPDAAVIRERIFEPRVAELYARRVDKHIRRWGNHPSVGLWFMHFNLAFYYWAMAPDKVGAGYKPTDAAFAAKERFILEAQHIARQFDTRPMYHHSCGAVGDIFTINCYIGPNAPLQEREEWPSAWAQNHSFPLVACEHCCFLIPYWFRPRQFPLSVVYAGDPIFDEITSMFLGNRAYEQLTPEVFDRYDIGATPRGDRTRALIRVHEGYQEVKSQVARQSLRAWRTWGVSGIIFNAINWDFKDAEGQPLPVMRALARYFGDTDLYIAGQPGDWPSKDHVFYPGEAIRKQVVLLNDRSRDVPASLRVQLVDESGRELATVSGQTVAQAGVPSFFPVEFAAPETTEARHLSLRVSAEPAELFQPDAFALSVLPREAPPAVRGRVLLWDPVGDTRAVLQRAGVRAELLTATSDLSGADLVVVGRKAWNDDFMKVAGKLGLEAAITRGLNLLAFEQTEGAPCGAPVEEQSWRQAFIAQPGHPFLARHRPGRRALHQPG
jgi:beta-galactosidase